MSVLYETQTDSKAEALLLYNGDWDYVQSSFNFGILCLAE